MRVNEWLRCFLVAIAVGLGATGCGDDTYCDAGDLSQALADAQPGDAVVVGACTVRGSFTLPAGVQLHGQDRASSRIVAAGGVALRVDATSGQTQVADLSVESDQAGALVVQGGGDARLERIDVVAHRGLGLGAGGLAKLDLVDVGVHGPVTAENADDWPADASDSSVATRGIVLSSVTDAQLERVDVSGFAQVGVLLSKSHTRWTGGGTHDTLGAGLMVVGGDADLVTVELATTLQGARLLPAYAGVFAEGASIESSSLVVRDSSALGLLHLGGTARHVALTASGNGDAAVRAQGMASFELSGAGTELADNQVAALVVMDSSKVTVASAVIRGTKMGKAAVGANGSPEIGDGIQLVRSSEIALQDTTLKDNGRVGVLLEVSGTDVASAGVTFSGVSVNGGSTQLGAIAEGDAGVIAPGSGWDEGIERLGSTADNDAKVTSPLEELGIVGPEYLPAPLAALP